MLKGALAASVTPLRDGGAALDEDGFGPVADFLAAGGLDGLLALGTNGEGILLSVAERQARGRALPRGRRRPAPGRRPLPARSRPPTPSRSPPTPPSSAPTRSR